MFPSYYPNRAIRRAVCFNKFQRLPSEWRVFLTAQPQMVEAIKKVGL